MKIKYNFEFPPHPSFRYEANVSLGKVEMHPGSMFGFSSYMNSGFVRSNVRVGRYCSIGRNVTLGSGAHDFNAISTSPFFKLNTDKQVLKLADEKLRLRVDIGNDVWIGDNAYIMSGVNVGNGLLSLREQLLQRMSTIILSSPACQEKWCGRGFLMILLHCY
ncbi:MAG: hypothetical protein ACKVJE_19770 [Pseudomonadales bacterium]